MTASSFKTKFLNRAGVHHTGLSHTTHSLHSPACDLWGAGNHLTTPLDKRWGSGMQSQCSEVPKQNLDNLTLEPSILTSVLWCIVVAQHVSLESFLLRPISFCTWEPPDLISLFGCLVLPQGSSLSGLSWWGAQHYHSFLSIKRDPWDGCWLRQQVECQSWNSAFQTTARRCLCDRFTHRWQMSGGQELALYAPLNNCLRLLPALQ